MKTLRAFAPVAFALLLAACGGGGGGQQALPGTGSGAGSGSTGGGGTISPPGSSPTALQHSCPDATPGYMTCYALIRGDAASIQPAFHALSMHRADASPAYTGPLRPADIQRAYNIPAAANSGTVAIVDAYDDPNAETDLAHYRAYFGMTACTSANGCFTKMNQRGAKTSFPQSNTGWAGEIALDIDMVSATCPACRIELIEADDNSAANLAVAEDTAAATNPAAISNSYGGAEYEASSSHYTHPNTIITASTGDNSYYGGAQQPASYASVVAVGGTSLYADANATRGWDEFAWSNGGSGCSSLVARPAWQNAAVTGCSRRMAADVAAFADPFNPGFWVWNTYTGSSSNSGGWYIDGGTSAASPLIASLYALAGNSATLGANAGQSLWTAQPSALFDITQGNNGYCTPSIFCEAGSGYDGPTGNGTPNGLGAF